ncbi:MAG TPA: hypothetical protein IAA00_10260 [Candidatus Blautia ornithocaccae]|nr:hypothetical protein [Candidatus Blautia ornithocaccae]
MIIIKIENGEETTEAYCDKCGNGFKWGIMLSKTRAIGILRKKGWKIGETHICEKCRKER